MSMNEYTKEELATLTPDERSALELETDDSEFLNQIAQDGESTDESTDETNVEAKNVDADSKAVDEGKADEPTTTADEVKDEDSITPIYKTGELQDSKELRAELSTKKSEALAKLLDGEITAAEYSEIETEVYTQISQMDAAVLKAQVSQEMTSQQLAREWDKELNKLAITAKSEGLDYKGDAAKGEEFDTLLRVFGNEAIAKGMTDDGLKASKWALAQAHSVMKTRYGIVSKIINSTTNQEDKPATLRHGLTTLTNLPAADKSNVSDDVVSRLGTLQGDDLELAMAQMSDKEIERLMASV